MRRGVGTGLVVATVTSALLLNLAVSAKTLPPTALDERLAGGSDVDVEATTDTDGDADVDVGQCSSSGGGSLDEVERALEERMARSAFYNAGQGEPNLPAVLAHDRLRGADAVVGEKEEVEDEGLCRQGDFNSTVVCDGRQVTAVPTAEIPDSFLDLLVLNATLLERVAAGDLEGKAVDSLVLKDNARLTALGADAFRGLGAAATYLSAERNRLAVQPDEWGGDFFAPFRSLDALRFLLLESNNLDASALLSWGDLEAPTPYLPCLEYLSLKSNPLYKIGRNFFSALSNSPVKELVLYNAEIQTIDRDAFDALPQLEKLDLFNNFKLFQFVHSNLAPSLSLGHLVPTQQTLRTLDLSANLMSAIPYYLLSQVAASLEELYLSNNVFVELGMENINSRFGRDTFPKMEKLEILTLCECRIQSIHDEAFAHLPSLRDLRLDGNLLYTVPPAVVLPSLQRLSFRGFPEMFLEGKQFVLPDLVFELRPMGQLRSLTIADCALGAIRASKFKGLENLEELVLDGSDLSLLENDAFSELTSLRRLSVSSASGLAYFPVSLLSGPARLQHLDLSGVNLFPDRLDDDAFFQYLMGVRAAPMRHLRALNLSASLANTDFPMELLRFATMAALEEVVLDYNGVVSWSERKFADNTRLRTLRMTRNWDYINLTAAMTEDFARLRLLDLSGDDFICNDGVVHFLNMTDARADTLEVVGWSGGYGYYCRDMDTGMTKSFREFAQGGAPLDNGYVVEVDASTTERVNVVAIVLPLLATLACVPFVAVLANVVYNNRWYLEYRWAKYKVRRRRRSPSSSVSDEGGGGGSFTYDAFVSYNREDSAFVHHCLAARLEAESSSSSTDDGRRHRRRQRLRLCMHERDFQPGRTIIENIVSSLEQSRACIVVMSRAYARSDWCKFEALMALQLFQEDDRDVLSARRSIVVVKRNEVPGSMLGKTLRSVMKLRTYLAWTDPPPVPPLANEDEESVQRRKRSTAAWDKALDNFEKRLRLSLGWLDEDDEEYKEVQEQEARQQMQLSSRQESQS